MKRTLLFAFILVSVSSCIMHYYNNKLSITNMSGRELSVEYSNEVEVSAENNVAFYIAEWNIIKPDSTFTVVKPGNEYAWHEYIQEGSIKKLYLYVFETDTLKKYQNTYSMPDLVKMNKYFNLLSYSEQELERLEWNIIVRE